MVIKPFMYLITIHFFRALTTMQNTSKNVIASPCVLNCCLDNDDVCIGCFRTLDEIVAWTAIDERAKGHILKQCKQRKRLKPS